MKIKLFDYQKMARGETLLPRIKSVLKLEIGKRHRLRRKRTGREEILTLSLEERQRRRALIKRKSKRQSAARALCKFENRLRDDSVRIFTAFERIV